MCTRWRTYCGVTVYGSSRSPGREALSTLGRAGQSRGRYEEAEPLLEESRVLRLQRGDERYAAASLAALAQGALNREDLARARTLLEDALRTIRQYDHPWGWGMVLTQLGHVELAEGNVPRAHEMFAESATLFQSIGNPLYLSWTLEGLAGVAAAGERWQLAAQLCGARDALRARMGSSVPPAYASGYTRMLQAVHSALGIDGFTQAYERGEKAALDQLIAEVLREERGDSSG